ncbi:hypothetical protein BKA65DRAFT_568828 [Rhexocercosporidium sp. MPI-PUGE-AT-0058]|nr:hypothetical protein BKA65DRAFT_568828 [Rhexocercosporidium sp. MPI-PUGE-AT-0058]
MHASMFAMSLLASFMTLQISWIDCVFSQATGKSSLRGYWDIVNMQMIKAAAQLHQQQQSPPKWEHSYRDFGIRIVQYDWTRRIGGGINASLANDINSLNFPRLSVVGAGFSLSQLSALSSLTLPNLTSVSTGFILEHLPALTTFDFPSVSVGESGITITNTGLKTLTCISCIDRDLSTSGMNISFNFDLVLAELPFARMSGQLALESNGKDLKVNVQYLGSVAQLFILEVSELSAPALAYIASSLILGYYNSTNLTLGSLGGVTRAMAITDSPLLRFISFPELSNIGDAIIIDNNTYLETVVLSKLTRVLNVGIHGNISSLVMPQLTKVNVFIVNSSNPSFSCSVFDAYVESNVVASTDYYCVGTHEKLSTSSIGPIATGTGGLVNGTTSNVSKDGISGGAIAGTVIGCLAVVFLLASGIWKFLSRKNKREAEQEGATTGVAGKAELDNKDVPRKELETGQEAHEMPAEHGVTEIAEHERFELDGEVRTEG